MEHVPEILAATAFGLEAVTVRELSRLGYEGVPVDTGRVRVRVEERDLPRAVARLNLWLRSADRVLVNVASFEAKDFDALFEGVKAVPWERWIGPEDAFPVDGRSVKSVLTSVPACQRTVKKGIVERLLPRHGVSVLPETGATVRVEVALKRDRATLTLDTSGDGLHKRGYRPIVGEASLKETLAAGLVLLSNWTPERPLADPFCGVGTIAIEAAMIGLDAAPGLTRRFAAESWGWMPASAWAEARDEARAVRASRPASLPIAVHASDIDERALALGRSHAARAGVERSVHFKCKPFEELASRAEYGVIITNPPYGVRMGGAEEVERLYRSFPLVLRGLPTWSFHVLTARKDLEALVGQEATRRRKLFNAQVECTYYSFLGPKPPAMRARERDATDARAAETEPSARAGGQETTEARDVRMEPPARAGGREASEASVGAPAFGGLRARDVREAEEFAACLAKNARHRRKWPARGITCYRVYERDCPDVPLIVDVYEGHAHVGEHEREHSRTIAQQADWWDTMRAVIARTLEIPEDRVWMKPRPRQRGATQHERVSERGVTVIAREGGLKFEVNLSDYVDAGLFLDHRKTRAMVRDMAGGARVLNLFCYTGSFTVYAADPRGTPGGGAAETTSVDLSNTYLAWAKRNMALNGLDGPPAGRHRFVKSDVLTFLRRHPPGEAYDLVIADPPTFSNSTSTEEDWDVQRGHVELLGRVARLLSPRGTIVFSTNFRRFKPDEEAIAAMGLTMREVSRRTVPEDFRNKRVHRCWLLRHAGARADGASRPD